MNTTTYALILIFVLANALAYSTYAWWRDSMDYKQLYREHRAEAKLWHARADSIHDWSMKYWEFIQSLPDGQQKFFEWEEGNKGVVILLPPLEYSDVTSSDPPPLPDPAEAAGPPSTEDATADGLTAKLEKAFRRARVERRLASA